MGFLTKFLGIEIRRVNQADSDNPCIDDEEEDLEMDSQEEIDALIEERFDFEYEYNKPKVFEAIEGSYEAFWTDFKLEPRLVCILGRRRSGKDIICHSISEGLAKQLDMMVYVIGNDSEELPNFITSVDSIEEVPNDSIVIIGEAGIEQNSRESMSKKNIGMSKLISIISHRNLWVIVASQSGKKLDSNLITECDCVILLEPSLMMKDMERPVIKRLYINYEDKITQYTKETRGKGVCVIHSKKFKGVCRFKKPAWWTSGISTSYKDKNVIGE